MLSELDSCNCTNPLVPRIQRPPSAFMSARSLRLCLQLGKESSLPSAAKLKPDKLPTGSNCRWVSRSGDGLLVLKS